MVSIVHASEPLGSGPRTRGHISFATTGLRARRAGSQRGPHRPLPAKQRLVESTRQLGRRRRNFAAPGAPTSHHSFERRLVRSCRLAIDLGSALPPRGDGSARVNSGQARGLLASGLHDAPASHRARSRREKSAGETSLRRGAVLAPVGDLAIRSEGDGQQGFARAAARGCANSTRSASTSVTSSTGLARSSTSRTSPDDRGHSESQKTSLRSGIERRSSATGEDGGGDPARDRREAGHESPSRAQRKTASVQVIAPLPRT